MHNDKSDDLPPDVILSIQRILEIGPSGESSGEDDLDVLTGDFNPVDILNQYFPDEASLAEISAVQAQLAQNEQELQEEIDELEKQLSTDQDPVRMQLIQEMISDILAQMSLIREKATESEAVVRNITKDIQVLDLAKKNLMLSMTTLKRLQMLVNALTQLEDLVKEKKYDEVAQTLSAVKELSASFKPYTSVGRIAQVWRRIQELQGQLRVQLEADFESFYLSDATNQPKPSLISSACLVVDVFGPDIRGHFIQRYVSLALQPYRRIFRPTDEAGQLDNVDRRFAWFKRLLQGFDLEQGKVFPAGWRVGWCLFASFVEITGDDMATLLSKAKTGSILTVKLLLDTLQITTEFENAMSRKWATPVQDILSQASALSTSRMVKPVSSSFEPHMNVWVDAQDKALADMLAPHRGNKSRPRPSLEATPVHSELAEGAQSGEDASAAPVVVLPSSTELFYFYGQSLEQCAKFSVTEGGSALYELGNVCKKWLRIYAKDVLLASLKRPVTAQSRRSTDTRFDSLELKHACLIINTADYCQTTALELEEKIREKVADSYKENVTLQSERDLFVSVISSAITCQLRELESACDGAFGTMARTSWVSLNQVSGQSGYIAELVKALEQVAEFVKPIVEQKKYLRNFFDKASSFILAKFTNSLVKSRPLREIGAEQLLIDLQAVKASLLKLPGEALLTPSYTRGLTKSTTRLEALLKVIVTPVDPPEGFILNYTLLIGDASFSNFQKILDLKGTPKIEQNNLLDSFLTLTSTKPDLENTSFLSSLDMDPAATAQIGSPNSSRVSLPLTGDAVFGSLASPPLSGPPTGSSEQSRGVPGTGEPGQKREVFSDFRRFVSFGLRRDSQAP